jgi:hypothetical protein
MTEQTAEQEWQDTINRFMTGTAKAEGIDYRKDTKKQKDLDIFVKVLAGEDENADKPMAWFLSTAHSMVKAKHGIATVAPTTPAVDPNKPVKRAAPKDLIPSTLAMVPGSDGPGDVGEDEFADVDRLEGLELERAIAKMSDDQRKRYLEAA